jgi:hypothetical protein
MLEEGDGAGRCGYPSVTKRGGEGEQAGLRCLLGRAV